MLLAVSSWHQYLNSTNAWRIQTLFPSNSKSSHWRKLKECEKESNAYAAEQGSSDRDENKKKDTIEEKEVGVAQTGGK